MNELYAYDFDGTLIEYDSFKKYIFFILIKSPIKISWLIFIRLLKCINRSEFKKRIVDIVNHNIDYTLSSELFLKDMEKRIPMDK